HPYVPTKGEQIVTRIQDIFVNPTQTWHPYFQNAYQGGGFAIGAGRMWHASPYSSIDIRGSYSIKDQKRVEGEFLSPRLFHRRGELSILGGWRDAPEVGFYGLGMATSVGNHVTFGFEQPYASALLTVRPDRHTFLLRGGVELSQWKLKPTTGAD